MKKLALALVCLVSVAFFASCQKPVENPEPTISVITDEGFVQNGDVIDLNQEFTYGFQMASNTQTQKELKQLSVVTVFIDLEGNEETLSEEIVSLAGLTEYRYTESLSFEPEREIIGSVRFSATVTDVDEKYTTTALTLAINQPAEPLNITPIEWIRKGQNLQGNTEAEMAAFGLKWTGSYKEVFATIEAIDGATLYLCDGDDFEKITNDVEKAAYFADLFENGLSIAKYRNITTNNSANYNDMLAISYEGETYLIHIVRAEIETGNYGTQITIKGEAK